MDKLLRVTRKVGAYLWKCTGWLWLLMTGIAVDAELAMAQLPGTQAACAVKNWGIGIFSILAVIGISWMGVKIWTAHAHGGMGEVMQLMPNLIFGVIFTFFAGGIAIALAAGSSAIIQC